MALFAMMNKNSAVKIYRIETDAKTDSEILNSFQEQERFFETHYITGLPFEAGYTPSYSEHSYIKNFSESAIMLDAINRSTAIPKWTKNIGLENITALFMATDYQNNKEKVAIQSFTKKQILNASKYLWLNKNVFSMSDLLGFNIEDKLVAIIEKDKIKFKSFHNLRSIFDMNKYFAEATEQDLDNFIQQNSFDVPQGVDIKKIADNVIRTKVTLINNSNILKNHSVSDIKTAASALNFPLKTTGNGSNEKIKIPTTKKEIKELLDFLDEDYFNSEISKKRFRSNSKRPA
ncbi:hypothetical protein [Dickeya dianthicola]|uniref:hypothetical protein n=1 Tax=Dickeya dianthicola TaxID=204039 RepID=UPI001BDDFB2B|nr:hypothetical protein [Dickeya dianthicola]MBT1427446.1 hypothetical protein [Dickeya dianthicola]MBT1428731.1 hypothetical protein [Dickeya dianthicola]